MSHPGGEQGQRVQSFGLDRLLLGAPAFSNVAQNDRMSDPFAGDVDLVVINFVFGRLSFDHERDAVKIDEAIGRIKDLHIAADRGFTRESVPIQASNALVQTFSERILRFQPEQLAGRVVEISDSPF